MNQQEPTWVTVTLDKDFSEGSPESPHPRMEVSYRRFDPDKLLRPKGKFVVVDEAGGPEWKDQKTCGTKAELESIRASYRAEFSIGRKLPDPVRYLEKHEGPNRRDRRRMAAT